MKHHTFDPFIGVRAAWPLLTSNPFSQLVRVSQGEMATHTYLLEANGLLSHARFVADSLRPDPFQARLVELATNEPEPVLVAAPKPVHAAEASPTSGEAAARARERA